MTDTIPTWLFVAVMQAHDLSPIEQAAREMARRDGHDPDATMAVQRQGEPMPPMRRAWTWYMDEAREWLGESDDRRH